MGIALKIPAQTLRGYENEKEEWDERVGSQATQFPQEGPQASCSTRGTSLKGLWWCDRDNRDSSVCGNATPTVRLPESQKLLVVHELPVLIHAVSRIPVKIPLEPRPHPGQFLA